MNKRNTIIIDFFITINYRFWDGCTIAQSISGPKFHNRLPIVLLPYKSSSSLLIIQMVLGTMLLTVSLIRSDSFVKTISKKKSKYSLAGLRQSNRRHRIHLEILWNNCAFFSCSSIVSLWPRFFGLRSIRTDLFD